MAYQLSDDSRCSPQPQSIGLLDTVVTIDHLVQTLHDQIVSFDASQSCNAEKYRRAYLAEHHKLLQASEANRVMGQEIEMLRHENSKYDDLEAQSQRLKEYLLANEARYRALDEPSTCFQTEDQKLKDIHAGTGDTTAGVEGQAPNLEVGPQEEGYQPSCAGQDRKKDTRMETQAAIDNRSGRGSPFLRGDRRNLKNVQLRLQSLKRKHSELEEEVVPGQEQ